MESDSSYSGPERREAPRYKVSLRARWGGGEWAGREGTVTNLSADGCFVMTEGEVTEGELVQVQVELPRGEPLPLWGSVIHRVEGRGFALQFSTFSQGGARERLAALLREASGTTT
ncbi:MAG TPA: PilZ domain-containing protein [Pyrinomonadaceae bacterium]